MICLIDTNCDFHLVNISIPTNDGVIVSIQLILNKLLFIICEKSLSNSRIKIILGNS